MKKIKPIANTGCLVAACRALRIPYRFYDDNRNLVGVLLDREYFFANSSTPFNDEAIGKIMKDKEFMYRVMRGLVRMPFTQGFIDPRCNPDYRSYVTFETHAAIIKEIEKKLSYPIMIKMNSGSRGVNVFKCEDRKQAFKALKVIFDKKSQNYDYIALAQEYVAIWREFRVIVFQGKVVLVYEKDLSDAKPAKGNISPLHRDDSRAVLVKDTKLIRRFSHFVAPLFEKIPIGFTGLDLVIDENDELFLIELNSKPGFEYFVRDNGQKRLVEVYKRRLLYLDKDRPRIDN